MTTQKSRLREELEKADRSVFEVVNYNLDWWADEVWIIQRKHHERTVFLTFIVDAMHDGVRKKGEAVEEVVASRLEPQRSSENALSLRRGWEKNLAAFVELLETI